MAAFTMTCNLIHAQKIVKSYYDYKKTKVHEEYSTNNYGVKNGSYKEFSEYGGILTQGTCKNDIKVGKWVTNNSDGTPHKIETFNDKGEMDGPFTGWANGIMIRQGTYKNDKKSGMWTIIEAYTNYDLSDEQKKGCEFYKYSTNYKEEKEVNDGKVIAYFYPSGKIFWERNFVNGKMVGDEIVYFPNGSKQSHKKLDETGKLIFDKSWYKSGKLQMSRSWETGVYVYEGHNEDGSPDSNMKYEKQKKEQDEAKAKEDAENYKTYIADGDKKFGAKDYVLAEKLYTNASKLMPNEQYPSEKLKAINELYAEKNKKQDEIFQILSFLKKEKLPTQKEFIFQPKDSYTEFYRSAGYKLISEGDPTNYNYTVMDFAVGNNDRGIFSISMEKCNNICKSLVRTQLDDNSSFIYTDSLLNALKNLLSASKNYLIQDQKLKTNIEQLNQLKDSDKDNKKLYSKMLEMNEKEQIKISTMGDGSLILPLLENQNLVFDKIISLKGKDNTEFIKQIKSADTIEAVKKILGLE